MGAVHASMPKPHASTGIRSSRRDVEERLHSAAGCQPGLDQCPGTRWFPVEEPDTDGEDHVKRSSPKVEIFEASDEKLCLACGDVRRVATLRCLDHLGRPIDAGKAPGVQLLANHGCRDTVAAADLKNKVTRMEAKLVDNGPQTFAHRRSVRPLRRCGAPHKTARCPRDARPAARPLRFMVNGDVAHTSCPRRAVGGSSRHRCSLGTSGGDPVRNTLACDPRAPSTRACRDSGVRRQATSRGGFCLPAGRLASGPEGHGRAGTRRHRGALSRDDAQSGCSSACSRHVPISVTAGEQAHVNPGAVAVTPVSDDRPGDNRSRQRRTGALRVEAEDVGPRR
jgi:hypothetical protein